MSLYRSFPGASLFTQSTRFRARGHALYAARRHNAIATTTKPKLIDLSREIYHKSPAHPFHPPVVVTPWDTHQPKKAGNTILRSSSYYISMSDHAGTHIDAPKHFDPTPGAKSIDQMPLENFYTSAICLDLSHVALKATISVEEMAEALQKTDEQIQEGDTVLIYMAFNKRIPFSDERWQHDFPGLSLEAVHWLADNGCKIFGVEAISPAPEGELNFQAHNACGERDITHIEGLDNLDQVVGGYESHGEKEGPILASSSVQFVNLPLSFMQCTTLPSFPKCHSKASAGICVCRILNYSTTSDGGVVSARQLLLFCE